MNKKLSVIPKIKLNDKEEALYLFIVRKLASQNIPERVDLKADPQAPNKYLFKIDTNFTYKYWIYTKEELLNECIRHLKTGHIYYSNIETHIWNDFFYIPSILAPVLTFYFENEDSDEIYSVFKQMLSNQEEAFVTKYTHYLLDIENENFDLAGFLGRSRVHKTEYNNVEYFILE